MSFARSIWLRIETIHAVTYFDDGCKEAAAAAGLKGFWMGYFGCRAAPLGAVTAGTVEATFFNFAPWMVRRAVPDAWSYVTPDQLLAVRRQAATAALRAVSSATDEVAATAAPVLARAVDSTRSAGRPLFAANRPLSGGDPAEQLWQRCTTLREHRGDGHVAVLTANDVDGCEAHVLIAAEGATPPEMIQAARGWTPDDWAAATERLRTRGLLDAGGSLSPAGRALRQHIEDRTDELAAEPFAGFDDDTRDALLSTLDRLARDVVASDTIRFPNPMSLPRLAD